MISLDGSLFGSYDFGETFSETSECKGNGLSLEGICLNGLKYVGGSYVQCECTVRDFEMDFELLDEISKLHVKEEQCFEHGYWLKSKGFRKISGNQCTGGG